MPEVNDNKPSPLNIFMALVNVMAGDMDYQQLNEIVEEGRKEWEKENNV